MTSRASDPLGVIPAKAGIHFRVGHQGNMDSRFRGNDDVGAGRIRFRDVIPAKAGIQRLPVRASRKALDPGFRRDDAAVERHP
jgi:hypothetical protein